MTSDRTARRLSRILAVLPYIIGNDGAEIDDLVERFDYADRGDLVKDLHLVFVTGLPGYGPGDLIDVDLYDDEVFVDAAEYFSRPLRLTPTEALGLLAAGMTLLESDQAPQALHTAVDKLIGVIGADALESVSFDVPTPAHVATLREAIVAGRVVEVTYVSIAGNERTVRKVEGWDVTFSLGNWYFTGHCRSADDKRTFRVDRIESVSVTGEAYERPDVEPLGPVVYTPSESDHLIEFTVSAAAGWVAEYYPVESETLAGGATRIRMSVTDPTVAARLLLQLGDDVTDAAGDAVLEELESLRSRVRARYARTM